MPNAGSSLDDRVSPEPPPRDEEAALVRRAQLGSAAAFEQLVVNRGPHLYRYLSVRLRHEADALDVLQDAFTAAWQGLPRLKQPDKFWPWLVGIAAHKAADTARIRRDVDAYDVDAGGREDEDTLEIREALGSLPAQFRDVLLLRYRLQLSEEEVAAALGVRLGTVKSRTARARRALMELLR